jgi:hypothetical protein
VLPIGMLKGVTIYLDGVRTMADFEVIEIVDDTKPYPTLLGLDWEFDNQDIINLKTRKMTFESVNIESLPHWILQKEKGL